MAPRTARYAKTAFARHRRTELRLSVVPVQGLREGAQAATLKPMSKTLLVSGTKTTLLFALLSACTGTIVGGADVPQASNSDSGNGLPNDAVVSPTDTGVAPSDSASSTDAAVMQDTGVADTAVPPVDATPANCIACSGQPPALSRSYADGQKVCDMDGNDSGPVYAGVESGTYYLYMQKAGQGCPADRCIIYNREEHCMDLAGIPKSDALSFLVPHPNHPKSGWRPPSNVSRTFCESQKICTWDIDNREVRARIKNGQLYYEWLENGQWKSAGNGLLANISSSCVEPSGGSLPKYSYLCFTDAAYTP